jgi:hypothetical protein
MMNGALLKVFGWFTCLVVASLGGAVNSFGASRHTSEELVSDVAVVQEFDFDSYEELADWLRETVDDNMEYWELLRQLQEAETRATAAAVCIAGQTTPGVLNPVKPFRFKAMQLQFRVGVGDCGLIICSRIDFSIEWFMASPCCGFFLGPNPSTTRDQVCQGQTTSATAFLILTRGIPSGVYSLN